MRRPPLIKGQCAGWFRQKMIGVIEECRMELLPYRSVEMRMLHAFFATSVLSMTEKVDHEESQPIPKTRDAA